MDQFDDRIKLDVFKPKTTYQHDYLKFQYENRRKLVQNIKRESQPNPKRECCYKDNETFIRWRPNANIPFDLFWRPKEIIRTDPYQPFQKPVPPETPTEDDVIKTRPRIYMSPAISLDDIEDPEVRQLICSNMYTSESTKAIQESAVKARTRHIPNTTIEEAGDQVRLKTDLFPPLPETFRNTGSKWEQAQIKYTVDPTATFWKHKDPPVKCGACNDPIAGLVPEETKETIKDLIRQNKLRLPHDYPIPGYSGYKPRLSYGVPLAKREFPVVHPLLTVSQAVTQRYNQKNDDNKIN